MVAFRKATKQQAKLRLALCALAGGGKTYSMLAILSVLAELMRDQIGRRGRIAVIDTEHESASLYADRFEFDSLALDNHSPRAYVEAIQLAEREGYDLIGIDSLSHAWAGKNGALEQKDNAAARGGNSWTAWRDITPMHNALVDAMLSCRMHLVATMRTKMEYIQTTENGKTKIEKVGLAAIQREGMEYEFTIVGDLDLSNTMRVSKTRLAGVIAPGDVFERPGEVFARKVWGWLMDGAPAADRSALVEDQRIVQQVADAMSPALDQLSAIDRADSTDALTALVPNLKQLTGAVLEEARRRFDARWTKLTEVS